MDWDKLCASNAAAEPDSFTNTRSALNPSQPAISRQVTALEQDPKTSLFHRHARGLKLTAAMKVGIKRPIQVVWVALPLVQHV